jgi:hypothetical protein
MTMAPSGRTSQAEAKVPSPSRMPTVGSAVGKNSLAKTGTNIA